MEILHLNCEKQKIIIKAPEILKQNVVEDVTVKLQKIN